MGALAGPSAGKELRCEGSPALILPTLERRALDRGALDGGLVPDFAFRFRSKLNHFAPPLAVGG